MTRTQAKEKILKILHDDGGASPLMACEEILLALDGALVLETEVGQFSGIAHAVSRAE